MLQSSLAKIFQQTVYVIEKMLEKFNNARNGSVFNKESFIKSILLFMYTYNTLIILSSTTLSKKNIRKYSTF